MIIPFNGKDFKCRQRIIYLHCCKNTTVLLGIMRFHLFEFEDQAWFPDVIRRGGTDFLRYFLSWTELYKSTIPLLESAIIQSGENHIIDLCSGGGGVILEVYDGLKRNYKITLTDKFPNIKSYEFIQQKTSGGITFCKNSIDARDVPLDLKGFRVVYSAIHHFKPDDVKLVLKNAVSHKSPIAIFDGGEKSIFAIVGLILFHPIAFFLVTPFMKPFSWSRILFTYVIPVIPIYTIWDGCVSIWRMYTPKELNTMALSIDSGLYQWTCGKTKNRFGLKASYLIGIPKNNFWE